jgi:hypothetical protein
MNTWLFFMFSLLILWPCYMFFGYTGEFVVDLGYQLNQGHTVVGPQAQ